MSDYAKCLNYVKNCIVYNARKILDYCQQKKKKKGKYVVNKTVASLNCKMIVVKA